MGIVSYIAFHEQQRAFGVMLWARPSLRRQSLTRGTQARDLEAKEVKLTLQVLAPDSGAGQPQPAAARPAAQAGGPGGLGPKPPGAPAAFHHNNQRRRASEISMVDINAVASRGVGAYGGGAAAASPQRGTRAHPGGGEDEEADEDGGGGFCYGSDDRGAEGFMGSVRSIFSQCFGAGGAGGAHPGDRYQRV